MNSISPPSVQPLWQLLLKARSPNRNIMLNCDECFLILEYLADMQQDIASDAEFLRTLAERHLSCCPDCRQYYFRRLAQLEQIQQQNDRQFMNSDLV